ncbi:helix-turn-helix domain-containing protein [Bailinhaonella thermotolerans]|uniref:Helix-turn-helix domain-containing protein n=1 Tax=Bailinhaonella thermotolerans TaxID=1070861 RepID=A0A3A4B521_9ACTN|nr:helix-turn-helix domain-containing protein [Bailinhaonella thermotolerans]RJL26652.1 helix-turn-helix domain-containing protein [Bailinhaonella thermotolerans]
MSIGAALSEARQQAGMSVRQVSERTRIRETVIHAIERDDFSLCGGDFYARGHLRNLARAVGVDPGPILRAFEEIHGPETPVRASRIFQAETPVKMRERRSLNWTAAMAVGVLFIVVFGMTRLFGGDDAPRKMVERQPAAPPVTHAAPPAPTPGSIREVPARPEAADDIVVLKLKARKSSWVNVRDANGRRLFAGLVHAGGTRSWRVPKRARIFIGNAGAVELNVNGRDLGRLGRSGERYRRTFGPGEPTVPEVRANHTQ